MQDDERIDRGDAHELFNAGVLSRIGPHRMNVKLARALARRGIASLRFDLLGHGDSRGGDAAGNLKPRATMDIIAAMDQLQRDFGINRYAVLGICSGAVNAFAAAHVDPRIVGLMMFDGHWYRSRWTLPVRHWKRLRSLSAYEIAAKLWNRATGSRPSAPPVAAELFDARSPQANPPRAKFAASLHALVTRGVVAHFVYSGSVLDFYSYANQFRDTFGKEPFFPKVQCHFRPNIDHTFVSLESQRRMIELVENWIDVVRDRYMPTCGR